MSPSGRERSNSASLGQAASTHPDSNRQPQPLFRFRPDSNQQPAGAHSDSNMQSSAFRFPTESSKQPAFRPQLNSAKPPAASEPQDPATETMVVFDCRHPGCGKTFHSSDAVRKHARKQHVHWLRRIDEEASLTRLMHRTEQYSAKRIVLRSEHEASQRAVESDDSDEEPPEKKPEKKAPRAPAPRPKLAPPPRPSLGGGRPSQDGASPRDDKKPPPSVRSHKKQHTGAKAAGSDEEVEPKEAEPAEDLSGYKQPSCRWNGRRSAYDAILPHGDGWSTQQIEWFVGLWWTHLANASVAVFHGSLEQFSAWAAATEGLECLVVWLKRMPELGEDLLLLQLLELLEYADLSPLALLPELTEAVRALKAYSDKDVAETAERVVLLLEELQTSESIAKEERRRAKEKQRSERLHLRAVKAADHASARAAKGGKRKGAAAPPRSQQRQRREKDEEEGEEEEEEGEEEDEEEGEEEDEEDEEDEEEVVVEACFCGTQRHRYDNNLSFDGVWVQCEGCLRWCHGECVGMTAQQAKYADSYTCTVCAEASESSEASSAGCSDFASDAAGSDVDSDGSGLQFRRPGGAPNGDSERKEKEKEKKERRNARKEKRRLKDESRKERLSSQPPSGGKPRKPPAIPVSGGCTKNALCTRGFRHPGLCKPVEGRPRSISKPEARDGPPSSGRAPKPRSRAVSPQQQCHKNKNCPRGYRHPGASRPPHLPSPFCPPPPTPLSPPCSPRPLPASCGTPLPSGTLSTLRPPLPSPTHRLLR